ncbi:AGAP013446-PA-like protein [Anopheles sinensis]|uniref:AGAP013446-PA-like protein n=1 Tax=Anopheles sinensis TaxID=74873 RepID=A0A084VCW0_ANOSI|nr:AGAP013446-PA-like protein [Anopheles sinensis]
MGDGLLQRFSTIGTIPIGTSSSSSTSMPAFADGNGITQRIHHEPGPPTLIGGKYPVYGPGTGPDLYDEETPEFWHGGDSSGPGGFFPSFLPWGQPQGSQPVPPPPPPPPPPYPVYRGPYGGKIGKGLRFRGASVAVLTLLAFLFFLSILQNYIRDYSTTSQPTVILLSAGATKENLPLYPYRIRHKVGQRSNEELGQFDEEEADAGESAFGNEQKVHGEGGSYRARIKKGGVPAHHKRHQKVGVGKVTPGSVSSAPSNAPPFGDIFKVNGL